MKKLSLLIIVVALLTTLISCNNSTPSKPTPVEKKFIVSFDKTTVKCETWPFYESIESGSTVTESDSLVFTALIDEDLNRVDYWTISNMEKYNSARKSIDIEVGVENAIQMSDGTYKITADYSTHNTIKAVLEYDLSNVIAHKGKTIYYPGTELLEGAEVNFRPLFSDDKVVNYIEVNNEKTTSYHPSYNELTLMVGKDTVKNGVINVTASFRDAKQATVSFDLNGFTIKKLDYYKCYVTEEDTSRKEINSKDKVSEYDHLYFYNNNTGKLATDKKWYLVNTSDSNKRIDIKVGNAGIFLKPDILAELGERFEIKYEEIGNI